MHKHMIAELARGGAHVDMWLFCPYHPDGSVEAFARASADRKPGPGMALAAAEALGLDLSASWVVGDSARRHRPGPGGRGATAARRRRRHVPAADVVSVSGSRRPRSRHILRRPTPEPPGGPGRRSPRANSDDGGAFGSAYADELATRIADRRSGPGRRGRRLLNDATTGTPLCSPAATVVPPPSPTTCSATTSRACATGTDLPAGVQPEHQHRAVQRDRQRHRLRARSSSTSCSRWPGPVMC